jgi:hypothetical protein
MLWGSGTRKLVTAAESMYLLTAAMADPTDEQNVYGSHCHIKIISFGEFDHGPPKNKM